MTVDNMRVPSGATCRLKGTVVKGTIYIGTGSVLKANGVRVVGNVQAENSRKVVVRRGSSVGGSIQVVQGRKASVRGSRVNADVLFDEQTGRVRAKAQPNRRQSSSFPELWRGEGHFQPDRWQPPMKENHPAPVGGNNIVQGNKEDQCSRL